MAHKDAKPVCPDCKVLLVVRLRNYDGIRFWGCPNYPRCHHAESMSGQDVMDVQSRGLSITKGWYRPKI